MMKKLYAVLFCISMIATSASPSCMNDKNQPGNKSHQTMRGGSYKYLCPYGTKGYYQGKKYAVGYYQGNTCAFCGCDSSDHRDPKKRRGKKTMPRKVALAAKNH